MQGRTFEFEPAAPSTPDRHVLTAHNGGGATPCSAIRGGEEKGEGSSAGEEEPKGALQVVENPWLAAKTDKRAGAASITGDHSTSARPATPPPASPKKAGFRILGWHGVHAHPTASPRFFGSLSRMFGHHRPSASTSALRAAFYDAPRSTKERKSHQFGLGGGKGRRWETRMERNLRKLRSGGEQQGGRLFIVPWRCISSK